MTERLLACLLLTTILLHGQRRVDPKNLYHRIICVAPLTGSGTATDPVRPKYAPWPLPAQQFPAPKPVTSAGQTQGGIIAFSYLPSDDGRFALVEFVAHTRAAFQPILSDPSIQVFEKGRVSRSTIEAALQKYRKSFSLEQFGTVMP
jgi:hypothetical protein